MEKMIDGKKIVVVEKLIVKKKVSSFWCFERFGKGAFYKNATHYLSQLKGVGLNKFVVLPTPFHSCKLSYELADAVTILFVMIS